jgi:hypothetical protein
MRKDRLITVPGAGVARCGCGVGIANCFCRSEDVGRWAGKWAVGVGRTQLKLGVVLDHIVPQHGIVHGILGGDDVCASRFTTRGRKLAIGAVDSSTFWHVSTHRSAAQRFASRA